MYRRFWRLKRLCLTESRQNHLAIAKPWTFDSDTNSNRELKIGCHCYLKMWSIPNLTQCVVCSLLCIPAKFSNQTMRWKSVSCMSCSDRDWKRSFFSLKWIKPVWTSFPEKVSLWLGWAWVCTHSTIYIVLGNETGVAQALLSFQTKWGHFLKYLATTCWILFCAVGAN